MNNQATADAVKEQTADRTGKYGKATGGMMKVGITSTVRDFTGFLDCVTVISPVIPEAGRQKPTADGRCTRRPDFSKLLLHSRIVFRFIYYDERKFI